MAKKKAATKKAPAKKPTKPAKKSDQGRPKSPGKTTAKAPTERTRADINHEKRLAAKKDADRGLAIRRELKDKADQAAAKEKAAEEKKAQAEAVKLEKEQAAKLKKLQDDALTAGELIVSPNCERCGSTQKAIRPGLKVEKEISGSTHGLLYDQITWRRFDCKKCKAKGRDRVFRIIGRDEKPKNKPAAEKTTAEKILETLGLDPTDKKSAGAIEKVLESAPPDK